MWETAEMARTVIRVTRPSSVNTHPQSHKRYSVHSVYRPLPGTQTEHNGHTHRPHTTDPDLTHSAPWRGHMECEHTPDASGARTRRERTHDGHTADTRRRANAATECPTNTPRAAPASWQRRAAGEADGDGGGRDGADAGSLEPVCLSRILRKAAL